MAVKKIYIGSFGPALYDDTDDIDDVDGDFSGETQVAFRTNGSGIFDGDFSVGGDLDVTGDASVTGDLSVTGDITFDGKLSVGLTDWGTGATGILVDGSGYDWAAQFNARVNANLNGCCASGSYSSMAITANQTSHNSFIANWNELYIKTELVLTDSDNYASVWGNLEIGATVTSPGSDNFIATLYGSLTVGATLTNNTRVCGVYVDSKITSTGYSGSGRTSAFECAIGAGTRAWDYGLYVPASTVTTGIYVSAATAITAVGAVGVTGTIGCGAITESSADASTFTRTVAGAAAPNSAIQIGLKSATPTVGGGPSFLFFDDNSNGDKSFMGRLTAVWENATDGAEAGAVAIAVRANTGDIYAESEVARATSALNFGVGVTDPDTKLEVLHAGNQLKLSFDATDNAIFAVDTAGVLTITPSGAAVDFASKNLTSVGAVGCGTITTTGDYILTNAHYVGISAAERLQFYSAGVACFLGCQVTIGTTTPSGLFYVEGDNYANSALNMHNTANSNVKKWRIGQRSYSDVSHILSFSNDDVSDMFVLDQAGKAGFGGLTAPLAQLHIDQSVADAAIPTLILDQGDVSEPCALIGDGGATNYAAFASGGELTLFGTARVTRHLDLDAADLVGPAATLPADGIEGIYVTRDFSKTSEQSLYYKMNVPWRWEDATDVTVVLFWLISTSAADAAKFVRWGVQYKSTATSEAVAGIGTSFTQDVASLDAVNHTAGTLIATTFTTKILGSALAAHDQMAVRFYRDATNDDFGQIARLVMVHIELTHNKLGLAG